MSMIKMKRMNSDHTETHRYGFSFMRSDTGGQKVKAFTGRGATAQEALECARRQAAAYRDRYANELNQKARDKAYARGDRYRPSEIKVDIVSRSEWPL